MVAEKLKNSGNRFTGVDISQKMLYEAANKNIYPQLVCEDLTAYLQKKHPDFDAVVAADVFCYFGDIAEIIQLCMPSELIFSVESDESVETWKIQPNGRYKHNPEHIKKLLSEAGYEKISAEKLTLRQENGQDVAGMLFIAEA